MNIDERIKPFQETWEWAQRGGDDPLRGAARLYSDNHHEEWATTWGLESRDRAKLAAQAPAMARLLIQVMNRVTDPLNEDIAKVLDAAGVITIQNWTMTL